MTGAVCLDQAQLVRGENAFCQVVSHATFRNAMELMLATSPSVTCQKVRARGRF
jgi:hypothetical protein